MIVLWLTVVLASIPGMQTPEQFRIGEVRQAGDRLVASNREFIGITIQDNQGGQPSPPMTFEADLNEEYTERVLSLDGARRSALFSRFYARALERESTAAGAATKK